MVVGEEEVGEEEEEEEEEEEMGCGALGSGRASRDWPRYAMYSSTGSVRNASSRHDGGGFLLLLLFEEDDDEEEEEESRNGVDAVRNERDGGGVARGCSGRRRDKARNIRKHTKLERQNLIFIT